MNRSDRRYGRGFQLFIGLRDPSIAVSDGLTKRAALLTLDELDNGDAYDFGFGSKPPSVHKLVDHADQVVWHAYG
jgi:hypothetical protein